MRSRITRGSWIAVGMLVAAFATSAVADTLTNKQIGYSLFVPKGFKKSDKGGFYDFAFNQDYYALDILTCDEELYMKESFSGYHRKVATYFFPTRTAADIAKLREERAKKSDKDKGEIDAWFSLDRVYQGFDEYAKDKIQGFYFSDEKPGKYGGFDCVVREMFFEKLTQVPQRWIACSYKVPGGEFAVLFTCTDQHFKKFKGECQKTFGTLKLLDAAGPKPKDPQNKITMNVEVGSDEKVDYKKMSLQEKLDHVAAVREKAFKKAKDDLPKGWNSFETDHFLICHDGELGSAKEASRHAEAVIAWLSERFGAIGTDPTQAMILKLHTKDEQPNFSVTTGSSDPARVMVVDVYRDFNGKFSFASVADDVMWRWFDQKNPDLSSRMPWWLRSGLDGIMRDSVAKGTKLDFGMDMWERESMTDALRADRDFKGKPEEAPLKPVKLLLHSPAKDIYGKNFSWGEAQCSSTVRYFLEGPGSRNEKTKTILPNYVANLSELVSEVEARLEAQNKEESERKKNGGEMTDEERLKAEDEAYKKKRENEYSKIEKELLDKAFAKTFEGFTEKDWSALDDSWKMFAKSRVKK